MSAYSKSIKRDRDITLLMYAVHACIILLLVVILVAIFGSPLVGLLTGILVWAFVLYKTPVFSWTFLNVKPNMAVIVGNQLIHDSIPDTIEGRTKAFDLESMREVGPGLRGKLPQEVVYDSVNLNRERIIGNGDEGVEPLQCYTSDDIPLLIRWQGTLTPLRGHLVNLCSKNETASVAFFNGQFEQFIINWVKRRSEDAVFQSLDDLYDQFKNLFGGPGQTHDIEREYGLFTNTPQIISIRRDPEYAKAAESGKIADKGVKNVEKIIQSYGDGPKPDPNLTLATAFATAGVNVSGLVLIPGISDSKMKDAAGMMASYTKVRDTEEQSKPKKQKGESK